MLYNLVVGCVSKQLILGIDGGATKTNWALCEASSQGLRPVEEGRLGPGSMKLLEPAALRQLLSVLPSEVSKVGVFLAGCATLQDRRRLEEIASSVWPDAAIRVGSDRESGFAAAFGNDDGIAVIAGTGSAITGRLAGSEDRAGGWGHLLGDSGGGYDLAIRALRRVLFDFDTGRLITALARDILRTLGLNTLRDLTSWAQTAQKNDLARLTPLLFEHESEAGEILEEGADALARLTAAVVPPARVSIARPFSSWEESSSTNLSTFGCSARRWIVNGRGPTFRFAEPSQALVRRFWPQMPRASCLTRWSLSPRTHCVKRPQSKAIPARSNLTA